MGTHLHPYVCSCGVDVESVDRAQMLNHHKISNNSLFVLEQLFKTIFLFLQQLKNCSAIKIIPK